MSNSCDPHKKLSVFLPFLPSSFFLSLLFFPKFISLTEYILHAYYKTLCTPGSRIKGSDPTRDWAKLACVCLRVSGRSMGWRWPAVNLGALTTTVLEGLASWLKSFWRRSLPSAENWIKDLLNMALPEQGPVLPTARPFHQEAYTNLLSSSIRGQTEWKPQSQKTNQTDHMNHSLV